MWDSFVLEHATSPGAFPLPLLPLIRYWFQKVLSLLLWQMCSLGWGLAILVALVAWQKIWVGVKVILFLYCFSSTVIFCQLSISHIHTNTNLFQAASYLLDFEECFSFCFYKLLLLLHDLSQCHHFQEVLPDIQSLDEISGYLLPLQQVECASP